ncbi:MAG: DUF1338 domain-containing protein [Bacteroidales bacterium]|jgi:hypothetical protein|nr:DUF1338 domain-containing protein [Bacteroidales bacterium]
MKVFEELWKIYTTQNPQVQQIYDLFTAEGEKVVNDHIAFRTFDDPRIDINVLSRPFIEAGYVEKGNYIFEEKKLVARHFEIEGNPEAPRVFISQLETAKFSPFLQSIVKSWIDNIPDEDAKAEDLIFKGNPWNKPSFEVYNKLREESEYAAWVYVFGFCANHFTVSVNYLKKFPEIAQVNAFLKSKGFLINDSGGEVKGTPAELLEQSSTKAGIIEVEFVEGKFTIPSTYYEFAKRYPDENGLLYGGFIAKSADKIFESTNYYKHN